MSELRFERLTMPAATLGRENPLPQLVGQQDLHAEIAVDPAIPEEIRRQVGYGRIRGCLPYGRQDDYDRRKRPRAFHAAVLENEILRATFVPELGGRLWSLFHKPTQRELLYVNPVFQPGNLAIRNAWFSGGVEWNLGMIGHTPLTCSPMFAARTRLDDGTPVLRLYEWERIRQVPYQIDAYLPDRSPFLFVRVRIVNPHATECPMYWWSNMAVPEAPGTRVVVPAETAFRLDYKTGMKEVPIPRPAGTDVSYPTNIGQSVDYFFRVDDGLRPWIASLDADGTGLIQTSTARLRGRKLFVWGMGSGGRHWQEFLSVPDHPYVEIQAGLARTQAECVPMPAGAEWAWLEAYGLMQADAGRVHGAEWTSAWRGVQARLDGMLSRAALDREHERGAAMAASRPESVVMRGAGWGALERHRRRATGEPPFCGEATPFDEESLGEEQRAWLALLEQGAMPVRDTAALPDSWLVQPEWRVLLEKTLAAPPGAHWLAWLHAGVMRYHAGDVAGAREAWERSLGLARSAWALRNLAVLAHKEKRIDDAARLWVEAHKLAPGQYQLAVECGRVLVEAKQHRTWIDLLDRMPADLRGIGRIRYLEAQARLGLGEYDRVEAIIMGDLVVPDVQEGECSLTDIWFELQARRIAAQQGGEPDDALRQQVRRDLRPPQHLDFRMAT